MSVARVLRFEGKERELRLAEIDLDAIEVGANEVLVRVELATICGSDLWTYSGAREVAAPLTLGHEGLGRVVRSGRSHLQEGTKVVWSLVDSCGRCSFCTDYGLPQKCESVFKYGHSQGELTGAYGTHLLLRGGTTVLPVSADMNDALAATLCCAWSTAEACLEQIPTEAQRVLIVGMGMLGFSLAFLCKRMGKAVYVMDEREDKRELARALGVSTDMPEEVGAVVECVGKVAPFEEALSRLRIGGTAVIAGLVHPDTHINITGEQIVKNCWNWVGVHNYAPRHLHRALVSATAFQNVVELDKIFSREYGLDEWEEAFEEAMTHKWMRVVLRP